MGAEEAPVLSDLVGRVGLEMLRQMLDNLLIIRARGGSLMQRIAQGAEAAGEGEMHLRRVEDPEDLVIFP